MMTKPLGDKPGRPLTVTMDDDLFDLIDTLFKADSEFSSRADVARALLWAGAAVLFGQIPDDQLAPAWSGPINLREPSA